MLFRLDLQCMVGNPKANVTWESDGAPDPRLTCDPHHILSRHSPGIHARVADLAFGMVVCHESPARKRIAMCVGHPVPCTWQFHSVIGRFGDRFDAGRHLVAAMRPYAAGRNVIVLALPRGGVPVGYEIARALHAPLDVMLVRKLGVPGQEELAMGAIASGGIRVISDDVVRALGISERAIATAAANEQHELERRERAYRGSRPPPAIRGKTVILVDDGLATGSTMRAAVAAVLAQQPQRLVVAVPVGARESCEALRDEVEEVVCALTPEPFLAVGQAYQIFSQMTDDEVRDLLHRSAPLSV